MNSTTGTLRTKTAASETGATQKLNGFRNVVQIMEARHARFYDRAFGSDPAYWSAASPWHVLADSATPFLAVCSTRRGDACSQASRFVAKAKSINARAGVPEQDLSHQDINQRLGTAGGYTDAVDSFMGALDE